MKNIFVGYKFFWDWNHPFYHFIVNVENKKITLEPNAVKAKVDQGKTWIGDYEQ